jgi:hypothetical protein
VIAGSENFDDVIAWSDMGKRPDGKRRTGGVVSVSGTKGGFFSYWEIKDRRFPVDISADKSGIALMADIPTENK